MTILFTAMAIAAQTAPATVPPAPPAMRGMQAQQSATDAKPSGEGCACCKGMAGGGKMECCAKHGEGQGAKQSRHNSNR